MNSKTAVKQITKRKPPKRRRASHGQWVDPAKAVWELVSKKEWNVSDAVRKVVDTFGFSDKDNAFNGVRAAYYVLRNRLGAEEFDI